MINEPRNASFLSRINHKILINPKQITRPNTLLLILDLAQVSNPLSHQLTHVLDNHVASRDIFISVQTPVVDGGSIKANELLALLELVEGYGFVLEAERLFLCIDVIDETAIVGARGARILYGCNLCGGGEFGLFGGEGGIFLGLGFALFALLSHTDVVGEVLGLFRVGLLMAPCTPLLLSALISFWFQAQSLTSPRLETF